MKIDVLDGLKLKWQGVTDFDEFYKKLKFYLVDDQGLGEQENLEKKYIQKVKGDGSKDLEILWIADKKKPNEFFKFIIEVQFRVLGMEKVEVQQGDIKRKMQKGTFELKISAYMEFTDKWDSLKGLQKIYQRMIMNKRIEEFIGILYSKAMGLHTLAKNFLGLR
jgi:predicted GTPase